MILFCRDLVVWCDCVCSSMDSTPTNCFVSHGNLVNTNTMESYKKLDKDQLLQDSGKQVGRWSGQNLAQLL